MRLSLALATVFAAALPLTPAQAALDLTPNFVRIGNGMITRAQFVDGDKKYAVTLDKETRLAAEDKGATFRFTGIPQASMKLRPSPLPKILPFEPEGLVEYQKAALALLPVSAEKPVLESQEPNVWPINEWKSHRFVFTYTIAGASFRESITFLTLNAGQQIVVQTGGQQANFDAIAQRAEKIIRRWHEVLPGDDEGRN
jgi:hypothetical protein